MSTKSWVKQVAVVGVVSTLALSGAACSKTKKNETPKPPKAASAGTAKLADAADQLAGDAASQARQQVDDQAPARHERGHDGGAAQVPIEERKKRFVARTTKRIDELTRRIPAVDAKVKGLDAALVQKWAELKPGLDAKLAQARKDFDAYLASPTDEAFDQARQKVRRALGSIEDTLDAADTIGTAAKGTTGAAPATDKDAGKPG